MFVLEKFCCYLLSVVNCSDKRCSISITFKVKNVSQLPSLTKIQQKYWWKRSSPLLSSYFYLFSFLFQLKKLLQNTKSLGYNIFDITILRFLYVVPNIIHFKITIMIAHIMAIFVPWCLCFLKLMRPMILYPMIYTHWPVAWLYTLKTNHMHKYAARHVTYGIVKRSCYWQHFKIRVAVTLKGYQV